MVKVYNSAGERVATLSDPLLLYQMPTGLSTLTGAFAPDSGGAGSLKLLGPDLPVAWNGRTDSGQLAGSGIYTVVVQAKDPFGILSTWSQALTVLRAEDATVLEIYNAAGELVWRQTKTPQNPGRVGLSDASLVAGQPGGGLKIVYGSGSTDFVTWNGTGDHGQALSSGTYMVKVIQAGSGGKSTFTYSVSLLQPKTQPFAWLAAAPNPVPGGVRAVTISLQGAAPGVTAWGEAYNLAGEHVGSLAAVPESFLRWEIPSGLASGVYLLQISARDSQGRLKSAPIKIALLR